MASAPLHRAVLAAAFIPFAAFVALVAATFWSL